MSFCEFSSEVVSRNTTTIDNLFISEFLPNANENCVKVYLYGLYKCTQAKENTIEDFVKNLNIAKDDILSIFYYWQDLGLVQVISIEPISVRYLPVKNAVQKMKKYNVDKYTAFNITAQELIGKKMLTPRELEEFYYLIENLHMEKEAVLKIIKYCVEHKGENVSVSYVVTVAKNWAYDGVKTSQDVDDRLEIQERISGDVTLVLKAMGIKRQASQEEYQMYIKWTKELDVSLEIISHIAKSTKTKNFNKLDTLIMKCYSLKLYSIKEIDEYFDAQDNMFVLAKSVVKALGLWYDDLTNVVDTYIVNWLQLGFDNDAIIKLANYAFKSSIKSLEGLNTQVNNMFKLGLLTSDAIDNHLESIVKSDGVICQILHKLGIERSVNSTDRLLYKTWLYDWKISEELIDYATTLSVNKYLPMQYLNKVLSEYHANNIVTVEDAKNCKLFTTNMSSEVKSSTSKDAKKREYSKKELDSLFDNIYEVEI